MGTRHLIGVVADGDFRVAQYGQWDGYPSGQGVDVLKFVREPKALAALRENIGKVRWITDEDKAAADAKWRDVGADPEDGWVTMGQADEFYADPRFKPLSRDVSADVLWMIAEDKVEFLRDERDFALDSLFCEWAYVVDLDTDKLEVYKGFNKEPVTAGRWAGQKSEDEREYYPVTLVAEYSLSDLPDADEFVKIEGEDDEDE